MITIDADLEVGYLYLLKDKFTFLTGPELDLIEGWTNNIYGPESDIESQLGLTRFEIDSNNGSLKLKSQLTHFAHKTYIQNGFGFNTNLMKELLGETNLIISEAMKAICYTRNIYFGKTIINDKEIDVVILAKENGFQILAELIL